MRITLMVCGSRSLTAPYMTYVAIRRALRSYGAETDNVVEVVSGGARGPDRIAERWADKHGIPVKRFDPDWNKHGKSAGFIRNGQMVDYTESRRQSDGLIVAVWDGKSRGTLDSIRKARKSSAVLVIQKFHPLKPTGPRTRA